LVASVASTKTIAPPTPAEEVVPEAPPEPKQEVKEPKPEKKETPAPKPTKRAPSRKFQRIESSPSNEPTLEERLKERFENLGGEESAEEEAEESSETPAQTPSAPSSGVTNIATVEATDFPYAWYLNLLRTKISDAWDPPGSRLLAGRPNQVIIKFFLARDGTASELEVDVVSGAPGLESSARRAVQKAQPFPPLPEGYPEDSVVIAVRFTVSEKAR
ncbi:MAG TPA: TonB family protein, partial [bacterium]|nr:TonB family protein [bacterium]